jgi:uncharacterized membrane protein YciS (DUF1049 family)
MHDKNLQKFIQINFLFLRGASAMKLRDLLTDHYAEGVSQYWIRIDLWFFKVKIYLVDLEMLIFGLYNHKAVLAVCHECASDQSDVLWQLIPLDKLPVEGIVDDDLVIVGSIC